jgi:hypothetical protein
MHVCRYGVICEAVGQQLCLYKDNTKALAVAPSLLLSQQAARYKGLKLLGRALESSCAAEKL